MHVLGYIGLGIFVAIALSVFLLARDRKSKSLDKLGRGAGDASFAQQREDRNA